MASVDAEVFGDETHLAGGVTVAVTVPARLLQGCHQLRTSAGSKSPCPPRKSGTSSF